MTQIGFVTTIECAWGGSEELWAQTAARMAGSGTTVGVNVAPGVEAAKVEALAAAGCRVTRRPKFRRPRRLFENQQYKWLDHCRPEFVVISLAAHFHGVEWMQECSKRGIPYAVVAHAGDETFFHHDGNTPQIAAGYEQAAMCFFVSHGNMHFVRAQTAAKIARAKVIRNPFNVSYEAAPEWPPQDGVLKLACVARLEPIAKGQDILFQVLRAEKWRQRPLQVTLFGNGMARQTLQRLKALHHLENVQFGGFTADIEAIWKSHHALILPSRFEGLPLALVEAMLCGRPAIVTDVSGNAELIEDNVTGFIAAAPNPRFLDEAMERAWAKRGEWRQIGSAAAQGVRQQVPADPIGAFITELALLRVPPSTGITQSSSRGSELPGSKLWS